MSERLDYLPASFELHLGEDVPIGEAWVKALGDYAYVYLEGDGDPFQRAATRALSVLEEDAPDTPGENAPGEPISLELGGD